YWSVAHARMLNKRLKAPAMQSLRVVIILPPHADGGIHLARLQHGLRMRALDALTADLANWQGRVGVYNLWDNAGRNQGIYVHAKVQIYDDALLVCGSANVNRR